MVDIDVIREECFLDEILVELPERVAKPIPGVKGKNLKKFFNQFSDSLKDILLQYTCVDASSLAIALGTNVGNAYVYQRVHRKIVTILSETKYVPASCIKLATGCTTVAFGHETGTFSVGLVDPPIHKSFDSLTAQDIHHSIITCLEWSTDGLILYVGDTDGKISMSVVKLSEGILQTAIIITEDCSLVQLACAEDALLISTSKRTALWPFRTEETVQVGEKERKMLGCFGACFLPDSLRRPTRKLYAARPGLRIWTSDPDGKVSSTSVFKTLLANDPAVITTLSEKDKVNSSGQFGQLLMFRNQYVVTWDPSHIWVLDVEQGAVIGCHSNLGKIRAVAVCGHEIFVLLNQKERFLRRLILTTERVLEPSCLDAVVAGSGEPGEQLENEATGLNIASALRNIPFMALEVDTIVNVDEGQSSATVETLPNVGEVIDDEDFGCRQNDFFDKINAISLDEVGDDVVFNPVKKNKKKKKKKIKEKTDVNVSPKTEIDSVGAEPTAVGGTEVSSNMEILSEQNVGTIPEISQDVDQGCLTSDETKYNSKLDDADEAAVETNVETLAMDDHSEEMIMRNESNEETDEIMRETDSENQLDKATTQSSGEFTEHEMLTTNKEDLKEIKIENKSIESLIPSDKDDVISRQDSGESTDIYRNSLEISRFESYEEDRSKIPQDPRNDPNSSSLLTDGHHVPVLSDTWSWRSLPTSQTIEHIAISQKYIFCVDYKARVYFSDPYSSSNSGWEKAEFSAKQVYVSSTCDFICGVKDDGTAFVRGDICNEYPTGNTSHQILNGVVLLSSCSTCTWAITENGLIARVETSMLRRVTRDLKNSCWETVADAPGISQIVCYNNVLWARIQDDTLQFRQGNGKRNALWQKTEKKAKWIHMSDDGTLWIITPDDQIWFKYEGVWYQVTLGQYIIDDPSILESTVNFFSSVGSAYRNARTTEYLRHAAKGLIQSTKDMALSLFKDGGSPKQICCDTQTGVWLLDTRNTLHTCREQATGARWESVCPTGTAKSARWRDVTSGLAGYVWAIQPNSDLTCFHPNGPSYNVEGPTHGMDFLRGSPHGIWCYSTERNHKLYIRDGISVDYPQGFAWVSLSLRDQAISNIKHLSVGCITVWAVDSSGLVWIRIGSVVCEEGTVLMQAWLPLDNTENIEFESVEVNSKDSMVWGIDTRGVVYARDGVKESFLIGERWREVEGITLKSLCLSSYLVYGLSTLGEIVCRFGVSEGNSVGDYWKKLPGSYPKISVNSAGELWGISEDEKLYARKMKCLVFSRGEKETGNERNLDEIKDLHDDDDEEDDWEML